MYGAGSILVLTHMMNMINISVGCHHSTGEHSDAVQSQGREEGNTGGDLGEKITKYLLLTGDWRDTNKGQFPTGGGSWTSHLSH